MLTILWPLCPALHNMEISPLMDGRRDLSVMVLNEVCGAVLERVEVFDLKEVGCLLHLSAR